MFSFSSFARGKFEEGEESAIPGLTQIQTEFNFFKGKGGSVHYKVKHAGGKHILLGWKKNKALLFSNIPLLAFRQILNCGVSYNFYISSYSYFIGMNLKLNF